MKTTEDLQPSVQSVRQIFNEMAEECDHLHDLWYAYSFSRIDSIIRKYFGKTDFAIQKTDSSLTWVVGPESRV